MEVPQLSTELAPGSPEKVTLDSPKPFDYSYTHVDGIKDSFLVFSSKINDLDKELGKFTNKCLTLGRVAGLFLAIRGCRDMLRMAHQVFFRNTIELVPEFYESTRKDCYSRFRDTNPETYFIPGQYFKTPLPPLDELPNVLEELARSFSVLHLRISEFRDFTDEGLNLKLLLLNLERDLMYRASCAKVYRDRLNTPPIQRYIHQFTAELRSDFEKTANALSDFADIGVSAISQDQEKSSQSLGNILTVATFFSGVTAGTLAMSTGTSPATPTIQIASMLWFTSLVFSVGSALNCLLAMAWKETRAGSRGKTMPFWVTIWIDGSQLLFLGIAIVTFSAGLLVFAFASGQAVYTPYVTVAATAVTSVGLVAVFIWLTYEISTSPTFVREVNPVNVKQEPDTRSIDSDVSKFSVRKGLTGALSNALSSLRLPPPSPEQPQKDVEMLEDADSGPEDSDDIKSGTKASPIAQKERLKSNVKNLSILNTVTSAFISSGHQHKRSYHHNGPASPRSRLQLETSASVIPMTRLQLPTEPWDSIGLSRYGTIRDVAYSPDGTWFAVTCSKDAQSWTGVYRSGSEGMEPYADTWHQGLVTPERLIWSPASYGKKLIIKFEYRFDVWDLDAKHLQPIERGHYIKDVQWYDIKTFLVAEHNCVFKVDLMSRLLGVHRFEQMHVRSIALERRSDYLIVITRVTKSPEQIEPASGRPEKRLIIYDMKKEEAIYRVPVLENISSVQPIEGELDLLVGHKEKKEFQLWFLDAGMKGGEITARLKKRPVTPQLDPGDYVGPTRIGGNYDQFVLNATSSGAIDFWYRESGAPYMRFTAKKLQEEGLACLSWKKSTDGTATFVTAGVNSDTFYIWRGEEPVVTKAASSSDASQLLGLKGSAKESPRNLWQHAVHLTKEPSSDSSNSSSGA